MKKSKQGSNVFNSPVIRKKVPMEKVELGKRGNIFYDRMSVCFDDETNSAKSLSTSSVLSMKKRSKDISKSSFFFF